MQERKPATFTFLINACACALFAALASSGVFAYDGAHEQLVFKTTTKEGGAPPKPWTQKSFPPEDNFAFAVISDLTGGERPGVFDVAVADLNLMVPTFVMSVGDLIEGYAKQEEVIRQWDRFDDKVAKLSMPFFYAAGNHDLSNPQMKEVWNKRFGPTYYHFRYKDVLFLVLNSEDWSEQEYEIVLDNFKKKRHLSRDYWEGTQAGVITGFIGDPQVQYFQRAIEENQDVRWTFLFMHTPMWQGAGSAQLKRIEASLGDRSYTVFAGHAHTYKKFSEFNRKQMHIRLGTTGGVWLSDELTDGGKFDHIVWVTMTSEGPQIANLKLSGILNDEGKIPAGGEDLILSTAPDARANFIPPH